MVFTKAVPLSSLDWMLVISIPQSCMHQLFITAKTVINKKLMALVCVDVWPMTSEVV